MTDLNSGQDRYGINDDGEYVVSTQTPEGRNDINMSDKQALRTRQRLYIAGGCE